MIMELFLSPPSFLNILEQVHHFHNDTVTWRHQCNGDISCTRKKNTEDILFTSIEKFLPSFCGENESDGEVGSFAPSTQTLQLAPGSGGEEQNRQYELHKMGPIGDISQTAPPTANFTESRPAVSKCLKEGERSLKYQLLH